MADSVADDSVQGEPKKQLGKSSGDKDENYFNDWKSIDEIRLKRQIKYTEISDLLKDKDVVVLDVSSKEEYDCGHIKGAKNLSVSDITEKSLPKIIPSQQTKIIIYCEKTFNPISRQMPLTRVAFPIIYKFGYENIYEIEMEEDFSRKKEISFKDVLPFEETKDCKK